MFLVKQKYDITAAFLDNPNLPIWTNLGDLLTVFFLKYYSSCTTSATMYLQNWQNLNIFTIKKNCSGIKFPLNWEHLPQFSGTPKMNELGPKTLIYSDIGSTQSGWKKRNPSGVLMH